MEVLRPVGTSGHLKGDNIQSDNYFGPRGGCRIFKRGEGQGIRSPRKRGGGGQGAALEPMLKSLHRGPKEGGADPRTPPPPDPLLMCSDMRQIRTAVLSVDSRSIYKNI